MSADFVISAAKPSQVPCDGRPHFAFAGRSNVGKSSLLNTLAGRKRLAHVSGTPGRTRLLNVFRINGAMYFVDLPGYGFAKAPRAMREQWGRLITAYLRTASDLRAVIAIFDIRRELSGDDEDLLNWLTAQGIPFVAVLTKADKLARMRQQEAMRRFQSALASWSPVATILFSAVTRTGRDELLALLGRLANQPPPPQE
ncbi:MAG: ribosome biogenesis GTP-binding protein YihA/YsxC [Candidatus Sumerlaeaceae bacterium]|nr:ribosome biogenesis GTP-binding protein YihA/YsxC [Candidatus Sumerlaeaceae bacterium]